MSSPISTTCSQIRLLRNLRRQASGFTLVEIMVVVTIISFLVMAAVPAFQKIQRKARSSAVASDLRVFETAFQIYAAERGGFPAAADPGVTPPEMTGRLQESAWLKVSPIGGRYAWEANQVFGSVLCKAAISISTAGNATLTTDADQLEELDRMMDDGNLSTGNLIYGGVGALVWIMER